MKARELAEELMKHPDMEVKFFDFHTFLSHNTFYDIQIGDIAYSDNVIWLNGKLEE